MPSTTAAGTSLAISAGVPSSQTAGGYAALSYTEVGNVESLGGFGPTTEVVTFQPLKGAQQKHKGPTNYGSLTPTIALDDADAGQALLAAAAAPDNNALYAVKVTKPDGSLRYFQVRVFGMPENIGAANSMITASPVMEVNTPIVKVPAGAPAAPIFTAQPSISPTSGVVGTTFTANDGSAINATSYTRRWLMGGTSLGVGSTVTPPSAGDLTLEVTASGPGGNNVTTSGAISVTPATAPAPTLGSLALASTSFQRGSAKSVGITGASTGSTLAGNSLPSGFTVNSGARTLSYDGSGSGASSLTISLSETLSGATNSPRTSNIGVTVAAATATPAPVFTTQPSITPTSGPVGTTFTASDGAASNTASYSRRWLLGSTQIGTDATIKPNGAGQLTLKVTATGAGGSSEATSAAVTVSPGAYRVAAEGDSITAAPESYANQWSGNNSAIPFQNTAIGGSVLRTGSTPVVDRIQSVLNFSPDLVTLLIGANDANTYASAQAYADDVFSYTDQIRASGAKIAVGTILPRTGRSGWNTMRAAFNTIIRNAVTSGRIDGLMDFDTTDLGVDGAENDTAKYPDGLHPSSAGQGTLATVYQATINSFRGIANEPLGMVFADQTNATASTAYTSAAYTVRGLYRSETRPYSVPSGVLVSKNGGTFTSGGNGTVKNGDTLALRATSSATAAGKVSVTLTVGSSTATYSITTAGAGSRDWTPADLGTKLKLWMKPESLTGANDDDINSWPDSSPANTAVQGYGGGGSARPKVRTSSINGFRSAYIINGGTFLPAPALIAGRASSTTIFVANVDNPSKYGSPVGGWGTGDDFYPYGFPNVFSSYGNATRRDNLASPDPLDQWHIGSFTSAPNDWRYEVNGKLVGNFTSNTVVMGTEPHIGKSAGSAGALKIAEFVDCTGLTASERNYVEGYLAWKFGMVALLPSGHPWKSQKPTV